MPPGVADRLLRDAQERELDFRRQSLSVPMPCVSTDTSVPHRGWHGGQRVQGDDEPALLEQARPQPGHQRPHVVERIAHQGPRREELVACRRRRAIERVDRQIDSEQRRRKRLRRTVVEVACQPAPLVFAGARRPVRRTVGRERPASCASRLPSPIGPLQITKDRRPTGCGAAGPCAKYTDYEGVRTVLAASVARRHAEGEAFELVDRGPIPVERAMPIGRSPGPDRLVRIPNGAHVIGRQRHGIVRRVDRVDVLNDLRGQTQ